jgi:hypothetical protein
MRSNRLLLLLALAGVLHACKDDDTKVTIPPSDGSQLTLQGGGGTGAPNTVYVDMSADKQSDVPRTSWSLGFYGGSDFRVALNGFSSMSAVALTKNDLTQVTLDDTVGVKLAIGQGAGTLSMIDDVFGDISKTVIAAVSATDGDNKVYLVKPETASATDATTWYKIRVLRSGSNGYTLQYAKMAETTFKTASITKNSDYNFVFFSLESGTPVTVEPKKAEWDFAWSYAAYYTATFPYFFSDFVVTNNLGGVRAAMVDSSKVSYTNFTAADTTGLTFSAARDAIGAKWRATAGATTGIYYQYFFIVTDASHNYYKLKFVSMGINDGGSRGNPVVEYKLVK